MNATMKRVEVFEGNQLYQVPLQSPANYAKCAFCGIDRNGRDCYVKVDDELFSRHMLLLGGIGTGKTNVFDQILGQLRAGVTDQDVVIIFDTKGDFYQKFYRPGDVVISNDGTAVDETGKPNYWNIFREIRRDDSMEETIIEIAKSLFAEKAKKTQQPFFPNAARDLFSAVLTDACRRNENMDNASLRAFLDASPAADIRKMLAAHPDMEAMISYISDDRSPQTQGVISELQQTVREILIGNFKKAGTLSMRDLVRKKGGRFVFLEYDLQIGAMLSPVFSLLFDLAIKEALGRNKTSGNTYFITDEFRLLPNLQHVDDAVNFGRSLGVKFMIGVQNVEQVYEAYGRERAISILSGFMTSVCFNVNDYESKQYIKNLFGRNRKKDTYMSSVQTRGIIENVRDSFVVEDWDISRLGLGDAIIGLPAMPPFLFHFKKA